MFLLYQRWKYLPRSQIGDAFFYVDLLKFNKNFIEMFSLFFFIFCSSLDFGPENFPIVDMQNICLFRKGRNNSTRGKS